MPDLIKQLTSLRRGITPYGAAPHKPVLLLAVIDGFRKGFLSSAEVGISMELMTSFRNIWDLLVDTKHVPNFALPFFHLGSEPSGIWELIPFTGKTIPVTKSNSIKSFRALRETVAFAALSDELFQALSDSSQRNELEHAILQRYFQDKASDLARPYRLWSDCLKEEILYDPAENYARKVVRRLEQMTLPEREEEITLRGYIFKTAVLDLYDHRCSVSGLKIELPGPVRSISMVDACHIIPFAESFDDTITNGLALAPTLHRAFDRGLLFISDDYRIMIHRQLKDYSPDGGIRKFEGQQLLLPPTERFHPSKERLRKHLMRFER